MPEVKTACLLTFENSGLIFVAMSKETLLKAVELAGGQVHLARAVRGVLPGSKISQPHVSGWLNEAKIVVPPAEYVLPIAQALNWQITPHELRPDLYPNPTDALPEQRAA